MVVYGATGRIVVRTGSYNWMGLLGWAGEVLFRNLMGLPRNNSHDLARDLICEVFYICDLLCNKRILKSKNKSVSHEDDFLSES